MKEFDSRGKGRFSRCILTAALAAAVFLLGGGGLLFAGGGQSGGAAAAGASSRTLRIGLPADIMSTDPQETNAGITSSALYNVYTGLFKMDNKSQLVNDLCTDYKMVDDYTWEFTMRSDALFHNGDKVTAADMAFSLNRVRQDANLRENIHFNGIKEAIALDDTHLRVITIEPMATMIGLLGKPGSEALPSKYITEKGFDYWIDNPVGCGPYKIESYRRGDSVTLVPFDRYYGTKNPDWDRVILRFITESSTRVNELLAGNLDIIANVIPADWDRINNNNGTYISYAPPHRTYELCLKTGPHPTDPARQIKYVTADPRVREAIDYAINDKLIVDSILKGGRVTKTRIPEGVFGSDTALLDVYNYDPARARQLLAEAGYPNGFDLTLQAPRGLYTMDAEIAEAMAAMLRAVGIRVNLELLDPTRYGEIQTGRTTTDAFLRANALGFFDSAYGLNGYTEVTSRGMTNWTDKWYNDFFISNRANMNTAEREQGWKDLQRYIDKERPYVVIAAMAIAFGVRDNIDFTARLDADVFDVLNIHRK
jgi:peptide/nickel transport system substrate-binding protein